jgi:hypothetical protein
LGENLRILNDSLSAVVEQKVNNLIDGKVSEIVPVGSIVWFNAGVVPKGFAELNGSLVLRSAMPLLWNYASNPQNNLLCPTSLP